MSPSVPPIATGNINDDHIISDAILFEKFAVHYSKIISNNKKKTRSYLRQNLPRRSPRLAQKTLSVNRNSSKPKRKRRRSNSVVSESNPEAAIPVMRFSHLKNRRKREILSSKINKNCITTEEQLEEEIIEIKDSSDSEAEAEDFENNNNYFDDTQIRDETQSPMEMETSKGQDSELPTLEEKVYQNLITPASTSPPSNLPPYVPQFQEYTTFQYSSYNPQQQPFAASSGHSAPPSSNPLYGPSYQDYMQTPLQYSVRPPSLTPESPAFSPLPNQTTESHPQVITLPVYNCALIVERMLPMVPNNGGISRIGVFTVLYGLNCQTQIIGSVNMYNEIENLNFEAHFLPHFTYEHYMYGNSHHHYAGPQHPAPQPEAETKSTSTPEQRSETESGPEEEPGCQSEWFNQVTINPEFQQTPVEANPISEPERLYPIFNPIITESQNPNVRLNNVQTEVRSPQNQSSPDIANPQEDDTGTIVIEISTDDEEDKISPSVQSPKQKRSKSSGQSKQLKILNSNVKKSKNRFRENERNFRHFVTNKYLQRMLNSPNLVIQNAIETGRNFRINVRLMRDLSNDRACDAQNMCGELLKFSTKCLSYKVIENSDRSGISVHLGDAIFVNEEIFEFLFLKPYLLGIKKLQKAAEFFELDE